MGSQQTKLTFEQIEETLPTLSGSEISKVDPRLREYLDTMTFSKAAESAFSEWEDPEEAIYDET